jgi:membrane protein required for colicin V production
MNWLDIVIILLLLCAAWEGWKEGAVAQILGLVALVLGVVLGWKYCFEIGSWMGLEGNIALGAGFLTVLVAVILVVSLVGRLTCGLCRIVGLGIFDNILGALFSALKATLFIGLLIIFIGFCDPNGRVIARETKERSSVYKVVDAVCGLTIPFVRDVINGDEER